MAAVPDVSGSVSRCRSGPFRHKSAHAPVPLTEFEEALLVGAGAGFTGLAFWDLPTPPPYGVSAAGPFRRRAPAATPRCS